MKQRNALISSPVTQVRFGSSWWRDNRGVVAIMAALLLVAVVGFAALVIDLGWLYVVRSELQNGADAGALAGVVELALNGPAEAEAMAVTYATRPANFHLTNPPPGPGAVAVTILGSDGGDGDDDDDDEASYRLRVRVGPTAVPTIFARVWGISTSDVAAVAVAQLERRIIGTNCDLLPFAIRKSLLLVRGNDDDDDDDDDGSTYSLGTTIPWSPGNLGLLDLNGGTRFDAETINWIETGYPDAFIIPEGTGYLLVEGVRSVLSGSLSGALGSRLGERVLFPVFDRATGGHDDDDDHGGTTSYRVVDIVGGIIRSSGTRNRGRFIINIVEYSSSCVIPAQDDRTPPNNSVSTPVLIQ